MKPRPATFLLAVVALTSVGAREDASAVSLQVPVGPRAIAMGGAFTAIADDASATFWNPAGLPWLDHQEVTASHADRFGLGINDDFATVALPLSRSQAGAVDFSRVGFGDGELDYGDSQIGLSYGYRPAAFLAAGATIRYVSRHTHLDGFSVRDGAGVGFDLGLMFHPREDFRIGAVAQDVSGTRITYSQGEGTVLAVPQNLRCGAAYSPISNGTIAMDVDDLVHLGAEYAPIGSITLRSGLQIDPSGVEDRRWSFGLGLRWNTLRFDYALEDEPTLGPTTHFGVSLGFNFNPSQVRIEKVEVGELYSSLYKSYTTSPVGTVRLRNLDTDPITAQLSVMIPGLMNEPSGEQIVLRPRATMDVPLTAVLPDRVLAYSGDRALQIQVAASYQSLRLPRTERAKARLIAYGPGAIDWSKGMAQAAAWVTMRDPLVEAVARAAVRGVDSASGTTGIRNLDFTVAVFDAVEAIGVTYVPDPTNPYATISGQPKAVDTIYYPRETVARLAGDCDDTTVLFAALLGNVGIRTRFVGVPGHIFLLVDTDLQERNRLALGVEDPLFVIADDEVWIPLETTALGKGFAEAWRSGAESYASWAARGQLETADVTRAQQRFEPGDLPGDVAVPTLPVARIEGRMKSDVDVIDGWRSSYFAAHYAGLRDSLVVSAAALDELAQVYWSAGRLTEAGDALARALVLEPRSARTRNDLGVVAAARGNLDQAREHFRAATSIDAADPGPWLNLGIVDYARGDSAGADDAIAQGVTRSGGYTAACLLLGIVAEDSTAFEGTAKMTAAEARLLLLGALKRVPHGAPAGSVARPSPKPIRPWKSRTAGGRSADRAELSDLLYWKR